MNLIEAIQSGDDQAASEILQRDPAQARGAVHGGISVLMWALYCGRKAIAQEIRDLHPHLTFFEAAALGDHECVIAHLRAGQEIDAKSIDGFTALGFACYFGHVECCRVLLEHGADPNLISDNDFGVAPIHSALSSRQNAIVELLVKCGADLNLHSRAGYTPLRYCIEHEDIVLAEYLRSHGATLL